MGRRKDPTAPEEVKKIACHIVIRDCVPSKQSDESDLDKKVSKKIVNKVRDDNLRLTERHFPHPVPQTIAQGSRTQRRCHVCAYSTVRPTFRKDTRYMCLECQVALCVYPCFEEYHTKKYF